MSKSEETHNSVPVLCSGNPFYQPDSLLGEMDSIGSANGNVESGDKKVVVAAAEAEDSRRTSPPSVTTEASEEKTASVESKNTMSLSAQPSPLPAPEKPEDHNRNNQRGTSPAQNSAGHASPALSAPPPPPKVHINILKPGRNLLLQLCIVNASILKNFLQVKRSNLKKPSSERTGHGLRVKFNPLALLLDASLEGEFDLVQRIIYEVICNLRVRLCFR